MIRISYPYAASAFSLLPCRFAGVKGDVLAEFHKSFLEGRKAFGKEIVAAYKLNMMQKMQVLAAFAKLPC